MFSQKDLIAANHSAALEKKKEEEKVDPLQSSCVPGPMMHSCVFFSDRPVIRCHGERDDAHGLREGTSGGSTESELQQPRQSCGVSAHGRNTLLADLANVPFNDYHNSGV